ncbi:MAG: hypothetical protein IT318_06065 [Anaerolineales bacterium]|nr:hypothetical protein [Anaerolineales bacterium]
MSDGMPNQGLGCEAQLQAISRFCAALIAVPATRGLPAALLAALCDALRPATAGLLWRFEPEARGFVAAAVVGDLGPLVSGVTLQAGDVFLAEPPDWQTASVWLSAEAAASGAAALRPEQRTALAHVLRADWLEQGMLVLSLRADDRVLGVAWLFAAAGQPAFAAEAAPFAQRLAEVGGLALDRAQRAEAAAQPASTQQAGRARSEALAALSHELRTPLTTIKGYATALLLDEAQWSADEQREFLTLIDRECDTLQAMIGEVLDSALIDTGHLGIELEPVRLPRLAREVTDEVQRQTTLHRLVDDFPADFPLLLADPRRLRQVLRNILDNAVKYSPGGGLIVIRGEVRPADVVVSVADQGVGIAPEDLIPLFDKYFRVKSPTGGHVPGTGLGLPVTRAIVEAHGGRIWAESKLGRGTTLFFSVPRDDRALPDGD